MTRSRERRCKNKKDLLNDEKPEKVNKEVNKELLNDEKPEEVNKEVNKEVTKEKMLKLRIVHVRKTQMGS